MRREGRDVKQHVGAAVKAVGAARWMFLASGLLLAGIVGTVAIEVPINKQVVTWDPQALPENFVAIRERWLQFHVVRTVMGAVGFVCAAVGLALGGGSAFASGDGSRRAS